MSKLLFTLLMTFCVLSCAKTQSLGAGVSVDKEGNLIINAPLYYYDNYSDNPKIERAPSSMNYKVLAVFFYDTDKTLEYKGEVRNGFLSITINKPDESRMIGAMEYLSISENIITNGANVKIGQLILKIDNGDDGYIVLRLYPDRNAKLLIDDSREIGIYYIEGGHCLFYYSSEEVNISGKEDDPEFPNWHYKYDIHFKQGWNIVNYEEYTDYKIFDNTDTQTSITLSQNAVWVLYKW